MKAKEIRTIMDYQIESSSEPLFAHPLHLCILIHPVVLDILNPHTLPPCKLPGPAVHTLRYRPPYPKSAVYLYSNGFTEGFQYN